VAVLARNIWGARPHGERGSASLYWGSGGRAPSGVQGRAPGQGPGGLEAEALLVFRRSMNAANLPTFLPFGNANKSDICVTFAKNHGWPRNWGLEQNWGPVPPVPA